MKTKQITLSDIAKRLNVSSVTISKALRGHPDISREMTKRVKNVADELGYSPNFMARNLSARRSNTIGVIVPKIAHHFFGSIIENIYNYAFDNNYEIILTVSQEKPAREKKHVQTLLSMRVDGLIISITENTRDFEIFRTLINRGVPSVFLDRIPEFNHCNTVTVDDKGGAYQLIDYAIKLGYRKIAHFAGYTNLNIGRERINGFKQAMNDNNVEINPDWIVIGELGEKSGYDSFMKLYYEKNLPDLIFAVTYPVALGIYMAAKEVGLTIPDDIDVVCFGNSQIQGFLSPPLSCINQPTDQLAVRSMEVLLENIDNKENYQPKNIVLDTNLILRGTCVKFNRA